MFQIKDAVDLTQLGVAVFFSDPVDALVPELVCSNDTFTIVETFLVDSCKRGPLCVFRFGHSSRLLSNL